MFFMRKNYVYVFILLMVTAISANDTKTLENQNTKKNTNLYKPYRQIFNSHLHYVYGPRGDHVVYVNFNRYGDLTSKTTYGSNAKKHRFIYKDDCKHKDCQQFVY